MIKQIRIMNRDSVLQTISVYWYRPGIFNDDENCLVNTTVNIG